MNVTKPNSKVLWAVDPFADDKKQQIKALRALAKIAPSLGAVIEPVCVLAPDQLRIPASALQAGRQQYQLEAEKILQKMCQQSKVQSLLAPTLLAQQSFSVTQSARALVDYAKTTGAKLIGLSTHARSGLMRFFLGSFAETLMLQSDVPLLVVNPAWKETPRFKRILFATDPNESSFPAYDAVLALAKQTKATVVLFHKFEFVSPEVISGLYTLPAYTPTLDTDLGKRANLLSDWAARATKAGVKVETVFDKKSGPVAEAIVKATKKSNSSLVAMASKSGAIVAATLGSIPRAVLRTSTSPVWVVHVPANRR